MSATTPIASFTPARSQAPSAAGKVSTVAAPSFLQRLRRWLTGGCAQGLMIHPASSGCHVACGLPDGEQPGAVGTPPKG